MTHQALRPSRARERGMTLIELMIVVTIVAILGMIAVPSYRHYTQKAHRTEAKAALLSLQTKQESYYLQNNKYASDVADVGGSTSANDLYTLALSTASDGQSYAATATPVASDDTGCTEFKLTSTGVKSATGTDSPSCW